MLNPTQLPHSNKYVMSAPSSKMLKTESHGQGHP